ncbi:MAG TPA: SDR family NAD(P)-dependent oxidoreductase, partial [Burkholderiales bacterium]|nr:SDR family NAD(P)-dependent oxidoreductase [Burkholderiales bacterium]
MDLSLKGRTAFITGASRGIGKSIATAFAAEGVNIGLFGRDLERCNAVAAELRTKYKVRAAVVELDLGERLAIKPAVEAAIKDLGAVDILVNCAGGAYRGKLADIPDELWESYFAVKPLGLIRMTREAVPHLKASDQARVINISGTRGREPGPQSIMAGPINFGTLSVTKALANELGPLGITVNAIAPGSTRTRRWDELVMLTARDHKLTEKEAEARLLEEVPLGIVIEPEDISDLAVFLA